METYFMWGAIGLGFAWFLLHTFAGGRTIALPLRQSDLDPTVRATAWMCWHMVTAVLLLLPLLALAGWIWEKPDLIWAALAGNAALMIAGFASKIALKVKTSVLFQGWLFAPIVVLLYLAM